MQILGNKFMVVSNYPVIRWLGNDPSQQARPDEDTYWPLTFQIIPLFAGWEMTPASKSCQMKTPIGSLRFELSRCSLVGK